MKSIDLTGQKFGRLTVVERIGSKNSSALWLCKCNCGNETKVTTRDLRSGHTHSCGCYGRERSLKAFKDYTDSKFEDFTGLRFGRLTVLKQVDSIDHHFTWLCKCDCGNETIVTANHLRNGDTKSCGCMKNKIMAGMNKKIPTNNSTGVVGVSFHKKTGKYRAYLTVNGKRKHLGMYNTLSEAAEARRIGEIEYGMFIEEA